MRIILFCFCQFAPFMETTTFSDGGTTQELLTGTNLTLTSGVTLHNASTTTTSPGNSGSRSNIDHEEVFLWLPLVFVIMFALIIVMLIVASRLNFRCCRCVDRHGRSSYGESLRVISVCFSFSGLFAVWFRWSMLVWSGKAPVL